MYLIQRIEEIAMLYKDARHTVAEYVLQEQKNLHTYKIQDIAEATFTSKATVTRFAKTLGYQGWKDFIHDFVSEMRHQEKYDNAVDVNFPFSEKDSMKTILTKIKKVQIESIEDTENQLDLNMLGRAVNYIIRAKKVVIYGASPNIYLGELFRRKLLTIGKEAAIAKSGEVGVTAYGQTSSDCAIIISYAGNNETLEYLKQIKTLKEQKVPIIGITSGGNNYLRQHADCVLTISSREHLYTKISNFSTEESIHYVLNVLFSCCFNRDYEANYVHKVRTSKVLEYGRKACLKEMLD
ncbi:MAG: MurR/RpiR family transcriptional regulator [Lachnospiraceae bacterium]|nr:MurR/RpiR family transcriptional regulator [Lachnospiraceae bacterium]